MSRATYTIDPSHSHASFAIRHMMVSTVRGEFQRLSGEVSWDPAQPEGTTAKVTIETASIHTHDEKRDAHLRSGDFFDAENHPSITFVSKRAEASGGGFTLIGDLAMHGVSREVALAVTDITPEARDPWGQLRVGGTATTKVKRSDYGLQWNVALEAGGVLVGDEVKIQLDLSLIKQG
jgi:polyisoprenoid-binding protein YceI